jgi:hypothetical protein
LKRIILDEGVPRKIARNFPGHDVTTVPAEGRAAARNGKLLGLIERARFDVFVTADKNMEYQQAVLERRPFAVLLLSTNHLPSIIPHVSKIAEALDAAQPGSLTEVDCGTFVPRRIRKPGTPSP